MRVHRHRPAREGRTGAQANIGDVRGRGLLLGIELVDVAQAGDRDTKQPATGAAEEIFDQILAYQAGTPINVVNPEVLAG